VAHLDSLCAAFAGGEPSARGRPDPRLGEHFNDEGQLCVWRENQDAAALWLLIQDQWLRAGMDGVITGFDMAVALAYAQEAARMDSKIRVLSLVDQIRFVADITLREIREEEARRNK
jgi:hypothetical protein